MLRNLLYLIIASIIVILFSRYLGAFLSYANQGYEIVAHALGYIFAGGPVATIARRVISLIIIPFAAGLLFNAIYWIIHRYESPYLFNIVWLVWIMLATVLAYHK